MKQKLLGVGWGLGLQEWSAPRRGLSDMKANPCPGPGIPGQPRRDGRTPRDWRWKHERERLSRGSARWRRQQAGQSHRGRARQWQRDRHAGSLDTPISWPLSLQGQMLPSSQPDLVVRVGGEEGGAAVCGGAAGSLVNTRSHLPSREPPR